MFQILTIKFNHLKTLKMMRLKIKNFNCNIIYFDEINSSRLFYFLERKLVNFLTSDQAERYGAGLSYE